MELEQPGGIQSGPSVCRKRKRKSTSPPCSEKARELLLQKCGLEAGKYSWALIHGEIMTTVLGPRCPRDVLTPLSPNQLQLAVQTISPVQVQVLSDGELGMYV